MNVEADTPIIGPRPYGADMQVLIHRKTNRTAHISLQDDFNFKELGTNGFVEQFHPNRRDPTTYLRIDLLSPKDIDTAMQGVFTTVFYALRRFLHPAPTQSA